MEGMVLHGDDGSDHVPSNLSRPICMVLCELLMRLTVPVVLLVMMPICPELIVLLIGPEEMWLFMISIQDERKALGSRLLLLPSWKDE